MEKIYKTLEAAQVFMILYNRPYAPYSLSRVRLSNYLLDKLYHAKIKDHESIQYSL